MKSWLLLQHPEWLAGVAAMVALAGLALTLAALLARERGEALLGKGRALPAGSLFADTLPFAALLLLGIALLGPRLTERDVRISTAGVDVVLLMDVSQSMLAEDTPPSRAVRARSVAKQLLAGLRPGDRAALAAVAGRGVLLTPLTPDGDALARMLPALDTRLVRPGGSDLDAGLSAALEAFEAGTRRPSLIVLLSDGEITGASGGEAGLRAAVRTGTRIVALGLGSLEGAPVPDQGAPLRDTAGAIVTSRRHDAPLERMASSTDGAFVRADDWGVFELDSIEQALRREIAGAEGESVLRRERVASVLPFAWAAALLLLLEAIPALSLSRRLRRATARARVTAALRPGAIRAALCILPLLLLGAERDPADADARDALLRGLAHAELGDWPAAWESLQAAAALAEDPALASLAWYDLGVLYLEIGRLPKARDAFYESLALQPDDEQARFNLEWTLAAIEQEERTIPPLPDAQAPDGEDASDPGPSETPTQEAAPDATRREPDRADTPAESTLGSDPRGLAESDHAEPGERSRLDALEPAELERWLEQIEDDPSRALRALAGDDAARRPRSGPSW